jgi:hypothetical protein
VSKHGEPQDAICPWCLRRFKSRHGVATHASMKHGRSMPRTEEAEAAARLQRYHQDKLTEVRQ